MDGETGDNAREESMSSIEDEVEIIPEKSDFSKERSDRFDEDEGENNNQNFTITTSSPNEKISQLSSQGYYLIPLPKGKSKIWQFFGMCSKDGVSIMPEHSGTVFCLVGGCTSPEIGYCGNTTNLYGHLERKHPDIEMPRKRNDKSHHITNEYASYSNMDENEGTMSCIHKKTQKRMIFKFGGNNTEGSGLERKKRGRPLGKKDSYKRQRGESTEGNELNDETNFYEESSPNLEIMSLTKNQQQSHENSINQPKYEVIPIASPMKPKETDKIYESLIDYIITDHVGINIVKKKGFQSLLKSFNPEIMENFNINYDILTNKLKAKYQKYQADFKVSVIQQQIEIFSVMLEEWTSSNYVTSLEVSVSFVNTEWKIIHQLLANIPINPSQTNKHLTERITALLNEMNINAFTRNKEIISTTSTMFQSKRMKNILGAINIPSLELVLCTSLKEALLEGNCGRLLENLSFEVENMRVLEVYRSVTTRLEEVLKQETLQNSTPKDQRVPGFGLKLTTKQWIEIKELRCELDKVSSFLSILNKMIHVPLSMLIPLRYKFLEIIKPYPNDSPLAESFKKAMSAKIESYYSDSETILLLEKSMWLDPRFKNLALMNNKLNVEEQVMTELQRLKTPSTNENGQTDAALNSLDNLFQSLPFQMETEEYDTQEKSLEEIAQYNRCSSLDFKKDPLEWWKTMSNILPKLSLLAKKYQTIPLNTSNKSLRNERSVLSMEEINYLPFLNSFYNNLK